MKHVLPILLFSLLISGCPGNGSNGNDCKDSDGDGIDGYDVQTCPAGEDRCDDDPQKTEPGLCGCGLADTDTDSDGTPDCDDGCPDDPQKTEPGLCGCGLADADSDSDGTPDCDDGCDDDPQKTEPGLCGCGLADTDTDSDGTPDCDDGCPDDPQKTVPGYCGCGVEGCKYPGPCTQSDGSIGYTYTYDANGNLLEETMDIDGNGIVEIVIIYDGDGNTLSQTQDTDSDGRVDYTQTFFYDVNGNLVTCEFDFDADGMVDQISTYTYDSDGNLLSEEQDYGVDGTIDRRRLYTYDADGNMLTKSDDNDGDGNVDYREIYTYDADGNMLTKSIDFDADGNVDVQDIYTYDADGNELTEEHDSGADGTVDSIWSSSYDASGNLLSKEYDRDADGTADRIYTYTYDADGNLLIVEMDMNADGVVDSRESHTYDLFGNPLTIAYDWDADGVVDSLLTMSYDCFDPEADCDEDGVANHLDGCPYSPDKDQPAQCGCWYADKDSDGDGTVDCNDYCPDDADKIEPGVCGCGAAESDVDSDSDGFVDCIDNCPDDSNPGQENGDGDAAGDICDGCPEDPDKIDPGVCGCGLEESDDDSDNDGTPDCIDNCPHISNADQQDDDGDGMGNACDGAYLSVSACSGHACAVRIDGTIWCWGKGAWGELGNGISFTGVPIQVGAAADWDVVKTGLQHNCGIRDDGANRTLWCWGRNDSGQIGDGTEMTRETPVQTGTAGDWARVNAGYRHTCGIRNDGVDRTLWCWGRNNHGELGDGTNEKRYTPVRVGIETDWATVVASNNFTCGIRDNGTERTLWCWGTNGSGQLGNGDAGTNQNEPVRIGMETDWFSVGAGGFHACGIRDDGIDRTLWCWGDNNRGQLGDGTIEYRDIPTRVGNAADWDTFDGGFYFSCGIRDNGSTRTAWCWGENTFGQLGDETTADSALPVQVGNSVDWEQITAADFHACGIEETAGGERGLSCWGTNFFGQLGMGVTGNKYLPSQSIVATHWEVVCGGLEHSCGIQDDGGARSLWCWGRNDFGQLGNGASGSAAKEQTPVRAGVDSDWATVCGGRDHSCGIRDDGNQRTLWCWGGNEHGQLGDGTMGSGTEKNNPTRVGMESDWVMVEVGDAHSCGIRDEGAAGRTLWCWGKNDGGQVGDGTSGTGTDKDQPVQVGTGSDWAAVRLGSGFTCGIRDDGIDRTLWCWGANYLGQLGIGSSGAGTNESSPVRVGTAADWASLSTGFFHSCGIRNEGSDRTLWCWGSSNHGQLGTGSSGPSVMETSPVQIGSDGDWSGVSTGVYTTCAVRDDGQTRTLWCWGSNDDGALGIGSGYAISSSPVQTGTADGLTFLDAGGQKTCAVMQDGADKTLWCWGRNQYGQLGDGEAWSDFPVSVLW